MRSKGTCDYFPTNTHNGDLGAYPDRRCEREEMRLNPLLYGLSIALRHPCPQAWSDSAVTQDSITAYHRLYLPLRDQ